uniref:Uncharacterized protein n=1 Tax=Triticum urartu TaxID=4572 RepID=A0A8R7PQ67_TRIUA
MSECRVARHRQVHPPQVRGDSRPGPPRRKQRNRRISSGGHVDGGGGPAVLPGHLAGGVRVHHHSLHHPWRWCDAEPERRGREPGAAEGRAGDLRGPAGEEQVLGRGLHQLRRSEPHPVHLLLHDHPVRQGV